MIVKKLLSPRFERELESRDSLSVDVRHVFHLLSKYGEAPAFWERVAKKAEYLKQSHQVKMNLLRFFSLKDEIGYGQMNLDENLAGMASAL
ncbi:MAG: hypothetical protein AMJ41_02260 [candidate division Zixibacteria bacterium DG_27]|nr:MAG: hypothetical protein AMJ41_02260 [candidate division Zixibacteria bacterium DG_27]